MLAAVTDAFLTSSKNPGSATDAYDFWEKSLVDVKRSRTVPISTKSYRQASAFSVSETGYRRFFPWFVANRNPASVDDYFNVVMDILPEVDKAVQKREYWFFRGDVNIVMAWFRVCFLFF